MKTLKESFLLQGSSPCLLVERLAVSVGAERRILVGCAYLKSRRSYILNEEYVYE
jgi:hypothetical protein